MNTILITTAAIFIFSVSGYAQQPLSNVQKAFDAIAMKPEEVRLNCNLQMPAGGHLQGIQISDAENRKRLFITASSNNFSYIITAGFDASEKSYKAQTIKPLACAPLRHAGGCQIFNEELFVGIEDNLNKSSSQIVKATVDDSIKTIIKRGSSFKRSTAGAVGATVIKNALLIAVADWNAENIDFYKQIKKDVFDSIGTCQLKNLKGGAYQSINLLTDSSGQLFLVGFCKKGLENRADLFAVKDFIPSLVSSRYFRCSKGTGFRFGAGININNRGLQIITCSRRLKQISYINVFR